MQKSYKNINLLKWFNFCMDFRIYAPIAILYFANITGSYTDALLIFSIATISTACFELPTGLFSDIIGRKKSAILGQISAILSIFLYAISNSFLLLAVGAIFQGLASAFFSGNNDALLFDTLKENNEEDEFANWQGKTSSMFQIALGISSLVAGILLLYISSTFAYKFLFYLSIVPQIIGLFISLKFIEPKVHTNRISNNPFLHLKEAINKFKQNPKLRILSFTSMFEQGLGEAMYKLMPAFTNLLWPTWAIPFSVAIGNLVTSVGQHFAGKLIDRFNSFKILISRVFVNSFTGVFITLFPTILSPVLDWLTGFFWGLSWIAKSSLLQKEFSDKERATIGSINSLGASILFAFFAYSLGILADKKGPAFALIIANILSLTTLFLYWKLFKKETGQVK